jgi:SAM-dependent methyltransferase
MTILHFSPSRSLYRKLKKGNYRYESTDISGDFLADKSYNIKDIDAGDGVYDLIICYHILEHIDDDLKAMNELFRVLTPGGHCIIQTPFKDGEIYEDKTIITPQEREKHFGQDDHVRIYAVEGLQKRLEHAGFHVEVKTYLESKNNVHGLDELETILVCSKPN